jgi:hypothetical protein
MVAGDDTYGAFLMKKTDNISVTDSSFPMLNRYWTDPAYRRRMDAEAAHANELSMAAMDRGIAAYRARQEIKHQIQLNEGRVK